MQETILLKELRYYNNYSGEELHICHISALDNLTKTYDCFYHTKFSVYWQYLDQHKIMVPTSLMHKSRGLNECGMSIYIPKDMKPQCLRFDNRIFGPPDKSTADTDWEIPIVQDTSIIFEEMPC